ncbi:MAG: hypothetical protein Q7V62_06725, partial [Actinomycetota bacterium]|nr:hypothetical protein [Actinomycetota bacterium]
AGSAWQTVAVSEDGATAFAGGGSRSKPRVLEPLQVYTSATSLTGTGGSYTCYAGETVTFLLGNLVLGQTPCNGVVQVYQLAGLGETAAKGTRIAQLLQSLNTSGDPANIVLPDLTGIDVNVLLTGSDLDFANSAATFLAAVATATGGSFSLVDAATAEAHVVAELAALSAQHRASLCSLDTCNSALLDLLNSEVTQRLGGNLTGLPDGKKITVKVTASNGDADTVVLGADGAWKFISSIATGASYTVSVQSDADLACTPANASGTMPLGNVTNVDISCAAIAPLSAAVRVTVAGLEPGQYVRPGLVLGGNVWLLPADTHDLLYADANGTYTFNLRVPANLYYHVTLGAVSDVGMNCNITNGSGQNVASMTDALIDNITIRCGAQPYTIGGTIS